MRLLRAITAAVLAGVDAVLQQIWPLETGPIREPELSGDELVALRQLIEERFGDMYPSAPALTTAGVADDGPAPFVRSPAPGAGHPPFTLCPPK